MQRLQVSNLVWKIIINIRWKLKTRDGDTHQDLTGPEDDWSGSGDLLLPVVGVLPHVSHAPGAGETRADRPRVKGHRH